MTRIFTLIMACCLICHSCTTEDIADKVVSPDEDLAELTVVFSLPQTISRATDSEAPPTLDKNAAENIVSNAILIMSEVIPGTNDPFYLDYMYELKELDKVDSSFTQWKGVVKIKPGYYRIIAIANPPSFVSTEINRLFGSIKQPWEKLSDFSVRVRSFGQLNEIYKDRHFLMTNAHTANRHEFDYNIQKGTNNIAIINVQRACARVDYNPVNNNIHTLDLVSGDSGREVKLNVRFTHAAPVNISKNFYLFKTISFDEKGTNKTFYAVEDENNYVADSDWDRKKGIYKANIDEVPQTNALRSLFFSNTEIKNRSATDDKIIYQPLTDQPKNLFYLTENTLPGIDPQVNKLSTGVLFKAEFNFEEQDLQNLDIVYYYQTKAGVQKIYSDLENLKRDLMADKMMATPDTWFGTDAEIAKCKARKFKKAPDGKFYVWYSYWNRHNNNNNNNVMRNMEFAVIRNNVYRLSIRSVKSMGYPEEPIGESIWKPVGETPDELPLMLDVKVNVSDWVDRIFDYEI